MPQRAPQSEPSSLLYEQKRVIGLGEILWDCHPEGRQLGGAPANFAVMAARLGDHGILASRLGVDDAGKDAHDELACLPLDLNFLQTDTEHPTGLARVIYKRHAHGQALNSANPSYEIPQPAAWDFLDFSPSWRSLAGAAHAVCFGTLAQRNPHSRKTIQQFLTATQPECLRVFDVNLRPPFFDAPMLRDSLAHTTLLKMNHKEAPQLLALLQAPARFASLPLQHAAHYLLDAFPALQLVCITLGSAGSLLVTHSDQHHHPGLHSRAIDTVGAGDAFTAALVHYYLDGAPLPILNEAGNRWGAWVASQRGAIPPLDAATLSANAQAIAAAGA
ncbi:MULTISPECIES: PfkB family carbohydrate kinase [Acidobacterium]|uniref:Putative fructokinase n=1 Tax=Acidobacterium capsulatum (strain ATCC 51196 / DSM 11244 / BCRC 80197 / JCM 7670 / NBRC 15755 / NCIMB 13165 / 161) TaxID=240015 RepID=C1F4Z0_ACIC5|nr:MULTISPECIES: PfkB family carbohydrate kinase [Acidobacterium]ACO33184.1 putative fructokinase [Acidobacterium capsulatum ATCC 51196]HCT61847.1 carbohydrate kinase [Acidobacterium sp.]